MRHHLTTAASATATALLLGASWAAAHGVVLAVGALCLALVGIITAARTLAGLAPVRWLWRSLVSEPIARKLREEVRETLHEWWHADDGPGPRVERLERAAERIAEG